MLYNRYLQIKQLKEKFAANVKKAQNKINQEIHIRDIFVFAESTYRSFGEAKQHSNKYKTLASLERLCDHIELLANTANTYHQKYYCEKNEHNEIISKADCKNKITRLALNEFSLYTSEPMSIADFKLLIEAIQKIAETKHNNVHLLLSSLSVKVDNQILNMSLYVQCGDDPKIDSFCKSSVSSIDVTYKNTTNFSQRAHLDKPLYISKKFLKTPPEYVAQQNGLTISNNTLLQIKTEGGAEYTQAIDVCLDHAARHSKQLIEHEANNTISNVFIPEQIDHLVTSDTINLIEDAKISESIVQIDPDFSRNAKHMKNDRVESTDLQNFKMHKYPQTSVEKRSNGFIVKNPSFGSDCLIIAQDERKLSKFSDHLEPIIKQRNQKVEQHILNSDIEVLYQGHQFNLLLNQYKKSLERINQLHTSLLKGCAIGYLEKLFKTQNYRLKCQIKKILADFQATFLLLNKEPATFMHHVGVILADLKVKLKHVNNGLPNSLTPTFIAQIDQTIVEQPSICLS